MSANEESGAIEHDGDAVDDDIDVAGNVDSLDRAGVHIPTTRRPAVRVENSK